MDPYSLGHGLGRLPQDEQEYIGGLRDDGLTLDKLAVIDANVGVPQHRRKCVLQCCKCRGRLLRLSSPFAGSGNPVAGQSLDGQHGDSWHLRQTGIGSPQAHRHPVPVDSAASTRQVSGALQSARRG